MIAVLMLQKVYQIYGYINVDIIIYDRKEAAQRKEMLERSQEAAEERKEQIEISL